MSTANETVQVEVKPISRLDGRRYSRGQHPNSRANLKIRPHAPFAPGNTIGNGNRKKGVFYVVEWVRSAMSDMSEGQLRRIHEDKAASMNKRLAAELLLQGLQAKSDRLRREAISEIADRTSGKPHQSSTIHVDTDPTPDELIAKVRQQLGIKQIEAQSADALDE